MAKKIHYADTFQPRFGLPYAAAATPEQMKAMDDEKLRKYLDARQLIEVESAKNPVGWGWTMPSWEMVMDCWAKYNVIVLLGGNQSAKTTLGARMSVWAACEIPEAEVYNFHISEKRSIDDQQRFIYENLPDWLKNMPTKKGIAHSLQYTQKNGFTDGIAIMPPVKGYRRGGSIKFYNYSQFQANDQIIEGIKAHFVWADEKIPVDLFETIRMGRLGTYHGRLLITYTVVDGWNPVIEKILSRTKTLKTKFCNHPKIMAPVPILQESLSVGSCCIIYAHTADNPFAAYKEFMKLYGNESKEVILARAFGVPTKSTTSAFPLFSKEYVADGGNVVKHEDLPWLKPRKNAKGQDVPYPVTFYMALDPAGSKAWFMVWVAIDAAGTWWVYRESPENEEWALPGNKPGPATTPRIHGIKAYVEHITTAESGPEKDSNIYERIIDPRMGAAERQSQDGATTIISELDDAGLTFIPAPAASSEANKGEIEDGIQLINNLLAYKTDQPIDALNRPKLYVSDRCQNLIYALQEYTGKLGATEATKDPIDCYDAETEILTTEGWVPFPSLPRGVPVATMAKDGTLEYQVPTEYHDRHYTGPMIACEQNALNFCVTPNHRMLVHPQRPHIKIRLAKDIKRQDTFPITTNGITDEPERMIEIWPGKIVAAKDWAEFIGWYVAEGSATGTNGGKIQIPGRGYSVYISQCSEVNAEKHARIAALLTRLDFCFRYYAKSFSISSKDLWLIVSPLGSQSERYIPRNVMALPRHCLQVMWEAMVLGDGWLAGTERHYSSVSTQLMDDVTELLSKLGKSYGCIFVRSMDHKSEIRGRAVSATMPLMMMGEKRLRVASITNCDKEFLIEQRDYDGRVYCVSVPNETVLVRRNRRPLVAGNCLRYLRKANCEFVPYVKDNGGSTGVY